jgi:hypothetical protein
MVDNHVDLCLSSLDHNITCLSGENKNLLLKECNKKCQESMVEAYASFFCRFFYQATGDFLYGKDQ